MHTTKKTQAQATAPAPAPMAAAARIAAARVANGVDNTPNSKATRMLLQAAGLVGTGGSKQPNGLLAVRGAAAAINAYLAHGGPLSGLLAAAATAASPAGSVDKLTAHLKNCQFYMDTRRAIAAGIKQAVTAAGGSLPDLPLLTIDGQPLPAPTAKGWTDLLARKANSIVHSPLLAAIAAVNSGQAVSTAPAPKTRRTRKAAVA